jgi:hypothetical protein
VSVSAEGLGSRLSVTTCPKETRETGKAATVGEDKAYDAEDHGKNLREMNVTQDQASWHGRRRR